MDDLQGGKTKGKIKKSLVSECDYRPNGEMLIDEVKIKEMWGGYFSNLLNVENAREKLGEVPAVEGPVQEISRKR